jgi:hypothetical protein
VSGLSVSPASAVVTAKAAGHGQGSAAKLEVRAFMTMDHLWTARHAAKLCGELETAAPTEPSPSRAPLAGDHGSLLCRRVPRRARERGDPRTDQPGWPVDPRGGHPDRPGNHRRVPGHPMGQQEREGAQIWHASQVSRHTRRRRGEQTYSASVQPDSTSVQERRSVNPVPQPLSPFQSGDTGHPYRPRVPDGPRRLIRRMPLWRSGCTLAGNRLAPLRRR